ncbi:DUF1877 family protein [Polaromonas naphthalenivorans]|uniref:DUF1877 family protein n=1 Tax=Polaromonas naphthalenivorans (strain CJ2) TaxID=365044 RepID=A1VTR1_POLNA|nr:DUF1877 family protein [Polaromonas naphthalenivorans]ABM39039.1 hypothetical protein Pnap_3743 [Polaromonas naphthalenivorans CJ2]
MSMGARYIALHKDRLNALLSDPQASLSAFVFDDANQALITSYSLEQAWDAFRCLLEDDLPELNGGEFLQDADLGEGCFLISAPQVSSLAEQLAGFSADDLRAMFDSEQFQAADFYWENVWKENFEEISEMFAGLVTFFEGAASRDEAMLFYVG